MKKKYKVAPEVRQEFLNRIKNQGLSVAQAAKDAGVSETTVYGWLGKGAESVPSILELAKLKRENKELLELVGELTLKLSTTQKNRVCNYFCVNTIYHSTLYESIGSII
jgi:transposase